MKRIRNTVLAVLVAVLVCLPMAGCADNSDFNAWLSRCIAEGGIAGVTTINDSGRANYECYVDGEIVTVPGYEGQGGE